MSFATILAITMVLGGGWGIFLWLPRRRPGNRYRSALGRPYRDPRQWSQTYMDSLNSRTRY
jgi:hypothetical protein